MIRKTFKNFFITTSYAVLMATSILIIPTIAMEDTLSTSSEPVATRPWEEELKGHVGQKMYISGIYIGEVTEDGYKLSSNFINLMAPGWTKEQERQKLRSNFIDDNYDFLSVLEDFNNCFPTKFYGLRSEYIADAVVNIDNANLSVSLKCFLNLGNDSLLKDVFKTIPVEDREKHFATLLFKLEQVSSQNYNAPFSSYSLYGAYEENRKIEALKEEILSSPYDPELKGMDVIINYCSVLILQINRETL